MEFNQNVTFYTCSCVLAYLVCPFFREFVGYLWKDVDWNRKEMVIFLLYQSFPPKQKSITAHFKGNFPTKKQLEVQKLHKKQKHIASVIFVRTDLRLRQQLMLAASNFNAPDHEFQPWLGTQSATCLTSISFICICKYCGLHLCKQEGVNTYIFCRYA